MVNENRKQAVQKIWEALKTEVRLTIANPTFSYNTPSIIDYSELKIVFTSKGGNTKLQKKIIRVLEEKKKIAPILWDDTSVADGGIRIYFEKGKATDDFLDKYKPEVPKAAPEVPSPAPIGFDTLKKLLEKASAIAGVHYKEVKVLRHNPLEVLFTHTSEQAIDPVFAFCEAIQLEPIILDNPNEIGVILDPNKDYGDMYYEGIEQLFPDPTVIADPVPAAAPVQPAAKPVMPMVQSVGTIFDTLSDPDKLVFIETYAAKYMPNTEEMKKQLMNDPVVIAAVENKIKPALILTIRRQEKASYRNSLKNHFDTASLIIVFTVTPVTIQKDGSTTFKVLQLDEILN